jgi:hypothetical protein
MASGREIFVSPTGFALVYLANALAEVAVVAAQQNATEDAMRLWRIEYKP